MRIMPVNCYPKMGTQVIRRNVPDTQSNGSEQAFKGQAGKVAGALVGGAAAVGLAMIAAPVLVVAAPTLGVLGAIAGDEAEKKITGKGDEDK